MIDFEKELDLEERTSPARPELISNRSQRERNLSLNTRIVVDYRSRTISFHFHACPSDTFAMSLSRFKHCSLAIYSRFAGTNLIQGLALAALSLLLCSH
jgi:hypothetical protein